MAARSPGGGESKKKSNPQIKQQTYTEREVVSRIPNFFRRKERREKLEKRGKALPTIAESNKPKIIKVVEDRASPADLLRQRRIKTHAPIYHTTFGGKEVIGQSEVSKVIKAVKSGVPIVVPKINPEWAKLPQHERRRGKVWRNEGITSARQAAPGRTRRRGGGKRKYHKTRRRRKRKRKRRKHFKGGLFERPGVGIKTGQIVRIRTKNSTNDTKTWDPCWKVSLMMNRAAQVEKDPIYDKEVRYENIKPQGILSKQKCKKISGGKRRKTRRRKKHRHRHKRRTHKK